MGADFTLPTVPFGVEFPDRAPFDWNSLPARTHQQHCAMVALEAAEARVAAIKARYRESGSKAAEWLLKDAYATRTEARVRARAAGLEVEDRDDE